MKKLGLCVRYDCDNYGSMLQIFANQNIIKEFGWEYEHIRYDKRTLRFYIQNVTRVFNPYFMKGKIGGIKKAQKMKRYPEIAKGDAIRKKRIREYREKLIGPYSPVYKGYNELCAGAASYDAVMVGSDQLWTPAGIKSKFYNLLFVPDNIRKISYATSFGVNKIPENQWKMTQKYLSRIDYISTREINGARIIKELTGRDAVVALDPTLMYTGEEWEHFFPKKKVVDGQYLFAYFLGDNPEQREVVHEYAEKNKLKIVTCPFMDCIPDSDICFGDEHLYDVGPADFLNLIRGATCVCTDSFHGTVFSILSHKRFITFNRTKSTDTQTRNSRIDSLFELLELQSRRYCDGVKSLGTVMDADIDYGAVDFRLEELRNEAKRFLGTALRK